MRGTVVDDFAPFNDVEISAHRCSNMKRRSRYNRFRAAVNAAYWRGVRNGKKRRGGRRR